jgi:hypothetical protein
LESLIVAVTTQHLIKRFLKLFWKNISKLGLGHHASTITEDKLKGPVGRMEKGQLIGKGKTAEIYSWGSDRVLKLYLEGRPIDQAECEVKIQQAVQALGIPTPAVDGIHLGYRYGIIMERISGPTMLELVARQPWRIPELAHLMAGR